MKAVGNLLLVLIFASAFLFSQWRIAIEMGMCTKTSAFSPCMGWLLDNWLSLTLFQMCGLIFVGLFLSLLFTGATFGFWDGLRRLVKG